MREQCSLRTACGSTQRRHGPHRRTPAHPGTCMAPGQHGRRHACCARCIADCRRRGSRPQAAPASPAGARATLSRSPPHHRCAKHAVFEAPRQPAALPSSAFNGPGHARRARCGGAACGGRGRAGSRRRASPRQRASPRWPAAPTVEGWAARLLGEDRVVGDDRGGQVRLQALQRVQHQRQLGVPVLGQHLRARVALP